MPVAESPAVDYHKLHIFRVTCITAGHLVFLQNATYTTDPFDVRMPNPPRSTASLPSSSYRDLRIANMVIDVYCASENRCKGAPYRTAAAALLGLSFLIGISLLVLLVGQNTHLMPAPILTFLIWLAMTLSLLVGVIPVFFPYVGASGAAIVPRTLMLALSQCQDLSTDYRKDIDRCLRDAIPMSFDALRTKSPSTCHIQSVSNPSDTTLRKVA